LPIEQENAKRYKNALDNQRYENYSMGKNIPRYCRTSNNKKHEIHFDYNLSKYLIVTPLENQTAEKVTEALVKSVILIYSIKKLNSVALVHERTIPTE
jgi:hypothetical protein